MGVILTFYPFQLDHSVATLNMSDYSKSDKPSSGKSQRYHTGIMLCAGRKFTSLPCRSHALPQQPGMLGVAAILFVFTIRFPHISRPKPQIG